MVGVDARRPGSLPAVATTELRPDVALRSARDRLHQVLVGIGPVVVAFSGGVDSALLAQLVERTAAQVDDLLAEVETDFDELREAGAYLAHAADARIAPRGGTGAIKLHAVDDVTRSGVQLAGDHVFKGGASIDHAFRALIPRVEECGAAVKDAIEDPARMLLSV